MVRKPIAPAARGHLSTDPEDGSSVGRGRGAWPAVVSEHDILATEGLTKRFPRVTALDQLTVTVGPGVTGLVGANGAGKSTLIKILLGLLTRPRAAPRCSAWTRHPGRGDPPGRRLHARARLPAARRVRHRVRRPHGPDVRPAAHRRPRARRRRAAPRRPARRALPPDRRLLHRHEAAGQAGPGARARPAAGLPRRADQRPRPAGPRRHARADPPHRHRVRHQRAGHLPPARRAGADLRPRDRDRRRQAAALLGDRASSPRRPRPSRSRSRRARTRWPPGSPSSGETVTGTAACSLVQVRGAETTFDAVRDAVVRPRPLPDPPGAGPPAHRGRLPDDGGRPDV